LQSSTAPQFPPVFAFFLRISPLHAAGDPWNSAWMGTATGTAFFRAPRV